MGETSTEYSLQLAKAVEGEAVTKQETRVSTPTSSRVIVPGAAVGLKKSAVANQPLGR
jgi:hypothetical protein